MHRADAHSPGSPPHAWAPPHACAPHMQAGKGVCCYNYVIGAPKAFYSRRHPHSDEELFGPGELPVSGPLGELPGESKTQPKNSSNFGNRLHGGEPNRWHWRGPTGSMGVGAQWGTWQAPRRPSEPHSQAAIALQHPATVL